MQTPETIEIPIRGGISKVLVKGEGKPVIFLHGAGGLRWDAYLEELSKEYKVYAPFFPGVAGTTGTAALDLRNLWDVVLYYYDLFDLLGFDQVDLIGHSFGGMLAAEMAATDSRRFNNLLLLCPAGLWKEEIEKRLPSMEGDLSAKLFYDNDSPIAKAALAMPEDPEVLLQVLIESQVILAEATRFMWPIADKGLNRRLPRIRSNTMVVWGREDQILSSEYAYEFQRAIPGCQLEILEQSSHFPQLEHLENVVELTKRLLTADLVRK